MSTDLSSNDKIISQVAQYVYDHCDQPISLDLLAQYTGFSKYHFNRLFFAATGFQLGEFVQRQKLEKALYLIRQGNHNILDVALSIGYDSPSSFSRVFKKHYSVTPTDVARGVLPRNERAGDLKPKKNMANPNITPKWKNLPFRSVYGFYGKGFSEQSFSSIAGKLYSRLAAIAEPLEYSQLQPIGISVDNPWIGEQKESRFFAGFLNGLETHKDSLDVFDWQAGKWACFIHQGPHDTMWQTIAKVYSQWVLPNNITLKDQQIVQLYLNNPITTEPKLTKTELYFAVEEYA